MGKLNEMSMVISDLRSAAATISEVANTLQAMFSTASQTEEPLALAPTVPEKPKLTLEQVRSVLSDLSRKGYTADVRKLLLKYGADKLSRIDPSHYEALLAEAGELTQAEDEPDGT